jgi:hypothetical protein
MSRIDNSTIRFDSPATVSELIEALTELRDKYGAGEMLVRVDTYVGVSTKGNRVKGVTVAQS